MKTKESEIERDIRKNGLTLFNYHYNYVHPNSDLGLFRQLQKINEEKQQQQRSIDHEL